MVYYAWGWWFFWAVLIFFVAIFAFAWWPSRRSEQRRYDYRQPSGYVEPGGVGYAAGRHSGHGSRYYVRADQRIADDVYERLAYHGDIDATDIQVEVKDAVVMLRGSVDTRAAKRLAEAVADSVLGVKDVKNELVVGRAPASRAA